MRKKENKKKRWDGMDGTGGGGRWGGGFRVCDYWILNIKRDDLGWGVGWRVGVYWAKMIVVIESGTYGESL